VRTRLASLLRGRECDCESLSNPLLTDDFAQSLWTKLLLDLIDGPGGFVAATAAIRIIVARTALNQRFSHARCPSSEGLDRRTDGKRSLSGK
jgi:hypothetical protein